MVEGWGWPDEALPEEEELEEGGEEHWQWWGHNGWKEAVARVQEREKREEEGWGVEREEAAGGSGRERERVVFCLTTTAARIGGVEAVLRSVKGQSLRPGGGSRTLLRDQPRDNTPTCPSSAPCCVLQSWRCQASLRR